MTLREMSEAVYRVDEQALDARITTLYAQLRRARSQKEAEALRRRIAELKPLRRQSREMAEITGRYYERGYHRDERYCL